MKVNFTVAANYIRFCQAIRPCVNPDDMTVYPALLSVVLTRACHEVACVILKDFNQENYELLFVCGGN